MLLVLLCAGRMRAQSQAANGSIEGTIVDTSGGALPGATVTVTNTETGVERSVATNESGLYRAQLLPLGTYRVAVELPGFKRFEQVGVTLSAGQVAVVNAALEVGPITEVLSVTADAPVAEPAKTDLGRTLTQVEIKNLPLTSRNPYNFALLQPGVTGFETQEFGVPRFSANGQLARVSYQIDGNDNTEKDRAGLRLIPMSEVMIKEVQIVTSGFAPEFGQTTGLVYNAITPSGTNVLRGSASYRFQRKDFAAFPFFFQGPQTEDRRPNTRVNVETIEIGGPLVHDRWQYFGGFEDTYRDLSGDRVITIDPAKASLLGLPPQPGVMPALETTRFTLGRSDASINAANRLTGRYIYFHNDITNNINGGLNSPQIATDFFDRQHSASVQLATTIGSTALNELRGQFATRRQFRVPGQFAGTGPSISVVGAANFGGPIASSSDAGFNFRQSITQILDNVSVMRGNHGIKAGASASFVHDERTSALFQLYTFSTIADYLAAKSGANPRAYRDLQEFYGNPSFTMNTGLFAGFIQDDWRVTPDIKVLYGIRYDLYKYPPADPNAPLASSRRYHIDRNNWGPRVGIAWAVDSAKVTVVRASTGIMYDQPLLAAYENAIQGAGTTDRISVTLRPDSPGAPSFPTTLNSLPAGITLPVQSPFTIDPDFHVARTVQSNAQVERALSPTLAVSAGVIYTRGRNLPVITNINLINPIGFLADGRPVFSPVVSPATRLDPRFNNISSVQSIGRSTYKALTLQVDKRLARGTQLNLAYTLGKATDDAPLTSVLSVQGEKGRSDPTSLGRDFGPSAFDTRHTFSGSLVLSPSVVGDGLLARIANHNQVALLVLMNSGLPVTLLSNRELNNDGIASDRPIGVPRNSLYLPNRYNADIRYSRFVPLGEHIRAEVLVEAKNVFNNVQTASVNSAIPTNANADGFPVAGVSIPTDSSQLTPTGGYERRQAQIGVKLYF